MNLDYPNKKEVGDFIKHQKVFFTLGDSQIIISSQNLQDTELEKNMCSNVSSTHYKRVHLKL